MTNQFRWDAGSAEQAERVGGIYSQGVLLFIHSQGSARARIHGHQSVTFEKRAGTRKEAARRAFRQALRRRESKSRRRARDCMSIAGHSIPLPKTVKINTLTKSFYYVDNTLD
jgi:hypothetical protein